MLSAHIIDFNMNENDFVPLTYKDNNTVDCPLLRNV